MPANRDTPAMRQYDTFKKRHPDCLLFFRMGDFYELFDHDAVTAHKALGITLTQRSEGIPMAGVPFHSAENYLRRLIAQGFRVAVCDQVQDPREAKGVIERAVTRVLTPGTLVDEALLDESAANTLAAVCFLDSGDSPAAHVGLACVELSTGAFTILDCPASSLVDELARRSVSELLYAEPGPSAAPDPKAPPRIRRVLDALSIPGTARPSWHFRLAEAREALTKHFAVASLAGFGLRDDDPALAAAGAIIRYLSETQALDLADKPTSEGVSSGTPSAFVIRPKSLAHLAPPKREHPADSLIIDAVGLRALEIERTIRAAAGPAPTSVTARAEGSLLGLFLSSSRGAAPPQTPMGKRLIRDWLVKPLASRPEIESRHARVAALVNDPLLARALADALAGVQDVPRIAARVGLGRATPRDLVALGRSLARVRDAARAIDAAPAFAPLQRELESVADALEPLARDIAAACVDEPPAHLREGGLIRDGVDPALDQARALQSSSGKWLAEYQAALIAQHDLPSLKVGYNKVFGFYIELPAAQSRRAPAAFTRKQTLKGAERYITPELKDYENNVSHAQERALEREQDLFLKLCARAAALHQQSARFADTVAQLDVLLCFASRARSRGWTRPVMTELPSLALTQARHPVLEELLADRFVPNDCALGEPGAPRLALITGPNMAGKSTYIRTVALCVLLAHAGSFVPASAATIGITDRLFTRIGADDALHAGQSTFMVEMIETASILHHATERSLVILDEIGRGTSTLDGLSLAWAIAEFLARGPSSPHPRPLGEGAAQRRERDSSDPRPLGEGRAQPGERDSCPRTLFATHYHELTDLADEFPDRVANLQVAVREWEGQVIFLHRILPGRASQSYGIHVAKLAGLPPAVTTRAAQLLDSLRVSHAHAPTPHTPAATPAHAAAPAPAPRPRGPQLSLFHDHAEHPALAELKSIDLTRLSPLQAFDELRRLKERLDSL